VDFFKIALPLPYLIPLDVYHFFGYGIVNEAVLEV